MRTSITRLLAAITALFVCAPLAHAGGFAFAEPNAGALGRAGASAAIPDGPSTVYYNPAGLTLGHGLSLEAGVGVDVDRTTVTIAGSTTRTSTTVAIPTLFISQRLGDHFGVGLGLYRAPSQALDYPDSFAGRFRVQRASWNGTTLQPTVAGRPFSWLSIGFGLTVTFAELDLAQAQADPRYETRFSLSGKAIGLGGVIGLWARLYRDYLTFGWSYKSAVDLDHSGRSTITLPGSSTTLAVDDTRLTLPSPHIFSFALGSKPRPGTSIQIEARLALLRDLSGLTVKDTTAPPSTLISIPLSPRELVQLRAGVEQKLIADHLALRIGVGYDLGSTRRDLDPAFPDGDRVVLAAGLGYLRPDFAVNAGYMASFSPGHTGSRGIAYPADYSNLRHSVGVSLTIRVEKLGPAVTYD